MLAKRIYKYWRIAGTGFSFALFGLGAFSIALLFTILLWPCPVPISKKQRWTRHAIWRATWLYVRIMWLLGLLTFELRNIEQLHGKGELVVANHPSLLDVVFLLSVMPNTNCIVKAAMFKNPFTCGLVSLAGYISNNDNGEELINKAADALAQGQRLIIFPEGTRTAKFDQLDFKRGAANIALKAQCSIRPVLIDCSPATLRKNQTWYDVPDSPPHFTLAVLDELSLDNCIDRTKPTSVQARHLTQYMHQLFTTHLGKLAING